MKPAPSQGPERSPGSVRSIMQNDDDPAVQAVGAKKLSAEHEKFADFLHGAIMQNINLADRKAGIIFTLVSAATLFLFRQAPDMIVGLQAGPSVRGVLWWLIVVLLIGAAVSAFFVIFPRIRRRGPGAVFWGDIAAYAEEADFVADVTAMSGPEVARAKLTQCYDLSAICRAKYRMLRLSMALTAAGLVLFLLSNLLPAG